LGGIVDGGNNPLSGRGELDEAGAKSVSRLALHSLV
jgi:hypothetical protein